MTILVNELRGVGTATAEKFKGLEVKGSDRLLEASKTLAGQIGLEYQNVISFG